MGSVKTIYKNVMKQCDQLHAYENNARKHTEWHIKQIKDSILEFGFTNPILIDEHNEIIAGHGRVLGAMACKMKEVPCIVITGLSKTQQKALVIADNRLGDLSEWNYEMLMSELREIAVDDFNIDLIGFEELDVNEILLPEPELTKEPEVVTSTPITKEQAFTPNITPESTAPTPEQQQNDISEKDIDKAEKKLDLNNETKPRAGDINVCCPQCAYEFIVRP